MVLSATKTFYEYGPLPYLKYRWHVVMMYSTSGFNRGTAQEKWQYINEIQATWLTFIYKNETIKIEIVRSIDLQIFPYKVYNDLTLYTLANRYFATTQKGITFKDSYMRTAYITNRPQGLAPI